jgi:ATP adenylyltransferase
MDYLWSPWRYQYVTKADVPKVCIFCARAADASAESDAENYVIHRAQYSFVILNRFPYSAGHLMVAPYAHVASLSEATEEAAAEIMRLTRQAEGHIRSAYRAPGVNIGMNIGECAGAGIAGHIHMHVLPRWPGDVNFMTTVGETRVLPEDLRVSYEKLKAAFGKI